MKKNKGFTLLLDYYVNPFSQHFASLTITLVLFHIKRGSWSPEYIVAGIVAFSIGIWKRQVVFSLLIEVITLVCWRVLVGW